MLTVGYLLERIEAATAKELSPRPAYATHGAFEIAAPLLPGDPVDAHERVECELIANAQTQGGMLRFALTDEAIRSVLPDEYELCGMERAQTELLDALFAGELPQTVGQGLCSCHDRDISHGGSRAPALHEDAALAYARLCIMLRKPPDAGGAARELLWLSAQVFSQRHLAVKKLLRALGPYVNDLSARPNAALRFCRAASGKELLGTCAAKPRMFP